MPSSGATVIVRTDGIGRRMEDPVGDKSPKSRERGQKQKSAARAESAAAAKAKQDSHSQSKTPAKLGR